MTTREYNQNELYIKNTIKFMNEGGIWYWPDKGEIYNLINGKLKAETKRGELSLKEIVRKEFYEQNCISL